MASSLLNAGRQVGGSIGLAVLGTVAWTVVADGARAHAAAARNASWQGAYQHALAVGFDRSFLVAAGIALLILVCPAGASQPTSTLMITRKPSSFDGIEFGPQRWVVWLISTARTSVSFAEAKRRCQPAKLAASFLAACEASGFR